MLSVCFWTQIAAIKWTSVVRKPDFVACASAQSDQHLYYSLSEKKKDYTCNRQNFNIFASLYSCVGWFESNSVTNPDDRVFIASSPVPTEK